MKTYILLDGPASVINGLTFAPGEAVNTNHNLTALFPNRFKLAPAGIEGTRWPLNVNDVTGNGEIAVLGNRDMSSFRVVGKDNKVIAGCEVMSLKAAVAKYEELTGKKAEKVEKPVVKAEKVEKKEPPKPEEDEEEDSEDDEEESDEDASDESDDEESDDEEDEEEEKPAKKNKKADKSVKKGKKKSR